MGLNIDKVDFDPTDIPESDTIGAYLIGKDGAVVTATTIGDDEALDVNVVQATGFAFYDEDSAAGSGDTGQAMLLVREDALGVSTSTDGDYGHFKSTDKGELYTKDTDAAALLATIDADTGAILSDTNAMVADLAAIEALLITIDVDTDAIKTSVASIDSDTTTIASDTTSMDATLTALSKAEDAAHASGDKGIMSLAVRNDVEGSLVTTDGDYAPLQVDSVGRLRIIGDLDVVGNVADDEADSGNPLKIGGRGVSGVLTALSASNDRYDLLGDLYRRTWVNNSPNIGIKLSKPTISAVEAEMAGAPQAGRTRILVQNLSTAPIFVGPTGVLSTTGIKIGKNASMELPWGPDIDIFAISAGAITSDVRVLEVA